jgi:DNA-binding CsgD family transcriptional regulator
VASSPPAYHSEDFVAAALEPARWGEALAHLAAATGSDMAQLIGFGSGFDISFNWINGGQQAMSDAILPLPTETNFRVAAARRFPSQAILDERHYEAVVPTLPSREYVELCREWDIPYGCQTNLREQADGLIGLALLRSERNGRTTARERALFDRARRDAAAAVSLQIGLEEQGYRLIAGAFEAMSSACFVLDRAMRVRATTPQAEALLSAGRLRLSDGRPSARGDKGDALARAMRDLHLGAGASRRVILAGEPGASALSIQVHRLPRREWDLGFAPHAILLATQADPVAGQQDAGLRAAFGLTTTEAEIALMLARGMVRPAICAARGISNETLRSHLRAIYAKLGVRREAEVVRVLNALMK